MLTKMLPGIAGIFLTSFAAWALLSMEPISRIDGSSYLVALATGFPVCLAYLALPYCRMGGERRKKGARYFMSLAAPTMLAATGIGASQQVPIWNDRAMGISVRDAANRSAATIFSFTDATVLADKAGWGQTTETSRHSTTTSYCVTLPVAPHDWQEGSPILAWARISSEGFAGQEEIENTAARIKSGPIAGFRIIGWQASPCWDGAGDARKKFHLEVAAGAPLISWDPDPGAIYRGAWRVFWIVELTSCGLVILFTALSDRLARK